MASEVDICNLALSHLGDTATVSAIDPPEGSAQAQHCARFYPMARNALLEMATWNFSTRRAILSEVTNTADEWAYAYAMPSECVKIIAVHFPESIDDYSQSPQTADLQLSDGSIQSPVDMSARYTPQPYSLETLSTGEKIILTNVQEAVVRYTVSVSDPTKFSALFIMALSYLLASMLAGPILKGETGAAASLRMLQQSQGWAAKAMASDASQRDIKPAQIVPWIARR